MSGTEKTIDQFGGWEDTSQQHDFFGETNLVEDVITSVEKDDVVDPTKTEEVKEKIAKEKEEQELVDKQFETFLPTSKGTGNEYEDENEGTDPSKEKPTSVVSPKTTLAFLKEKGLVEYEEDPEKPLTDQDADNLLEDSWEAALEKEVESTIKDLPDELKQLIKFASKGGDVGQLLGKMVQHATSGINKNSDIDNEDVQVLAVTMDLRNQGHDQEYIDAQIEFLKEKDKLGGIAKKSFDKIVAEQEAETAGQVQRQKEVLENKKKAAREYKNNITTHINSLEDAGGLPISKQDKTVLPTYISEPTVELQDGRFVSEMQADLFKVMADKDKIVLLAKLLKSDFDFGAIERKKQTAAARGIKDEIQRADKTQTITNSSSGGHKTQKKAVWDMLD
jgi:hypothetical protein